jgi:Glycosyltransferase family 9 (heptosyltransferase)
LRLWRERLGARRGPQIGIAWSGNPRHKNDRNRSVSLSELAPIIALGLPLYCLQRELPLNDIHDFAAYANIEYFGESLSDFTDTAALIAQLDLVIAVDTAVAHLAGALGKPVWVLLPYAPDWRWMHGREDSPWYPTMRLLRQPGPGDWAAVLDRVRGDLAAIAELWRRGANDST